MARILAVAAHPDDETLFAGGFLAQRAAAGDEVYILCTTRGEGGEVGEPPLATRESLGAVREQELRCAAAALGAREVYFLPYVDPPMEIGGEPKAITVSPDEFIAAITYYLLGLRPDEVVTHGSSGEYGHPQHVYTHRTVKAAVQQLQERLKVSFLTWMANAGANAEDKLTNKEDRADLVIELTGTPWLEAKVRAALCHRTQHAMFLRNSGKPTVRDMVPTLEAFKKWRL